VIRSIIKKYIDTKFSQQQFRSGGVGRKLLNVVS